MLNREVNSKPNTHTQHMHTVKNRLIMQGTTSEGIVASVNNASTYVVRLYVCIPGSIIEENMYVSCFCTEIYFYLQPRKVKWARKIKQSSFPYSII